jgi:hypothetical protein
MIKKQIQAISLLCFCLFPIRALAQCTDQFCQDLRNIVTAAAIDFREYRGNQAGGPDLSINGTKVVCQTNTWANNVPTYMCYAQVPAANAQNWYATTLGALQRLEPAWRFQIRSPDEDHFVDAGPEGCEIPPNNGPYIGQCPLHLQVAKQNDGTMRLHFWMNSLSSPYLFKRPPTAPAKTVPLGTTPKATPPAEAAQPVPQVSAGECDDFCQNFKKAFAARATAFEDIRAAKTNDAISSASVKLEGATECLVNRATKSRSSDEGLQFVCRWSESSGSSAKTRFLDLVTRVQGLLPANWPTSQENEMDDLTGAKITAWIAVEAGGKHDVRIYVSGESVSLHITTWI